MSLPQSSSVLSRAIALSLLTLLAAPVTAQEREAVDLESVEITSASYVGAHYLNKHNTALVDGYTTFDADIATATSTGNCGWTAPIWTIAATPVPKANWVMRSTAACQGGWSGPVSVMTSGAEG